MISSVQNKEVKRLVRLREESRWRQEEGSVLVTGFKQIREIAKTCLPKKVFVVHREHGLPDSEVVQVTESVMKKITGQPSPEPIAAEFPLPRPSKIEGKTPLLVLDAIQDPGNCGTLLRTALALNWSAVFFLPNCVDPFNEKALRASRGALFWLPFCHGTFEELAGLKEKGNLIPYIADIQGKELSSLPKQEQLLLILGSESKGAGLEAKSFGEKITIPMSKDCESLNVAIAGAILMYSLI